MNIDAKQLASKPKKVGKWGDRDVLAVATKGGFHVVGAVKAGGAFETLGTGPHPAVARAVANKLVSKSNEAAITWTELTKADHVAPEHFSHLLPKYEAITNAMRRMSGFEE
jgi:hypothetical protein